MVFWWYGTPTYSCFIVIDLFFPSRSLCFLYFCPCVDLSCGWHCSFLDKTEAHRNPHFEDLMSFVAPKKTRLICRHFNNFFRVQSSAKAPARLPDKKSRNFLKKTSGVRTSEAQQRLSLQTQNCDPAVANYAAYGVSHMLHSEDSKGCCLHFFVVPDLWSHLLDDVTGFFHGFYEHNISQKLSTEWSKWSLLGQSYPNLLIRVFTMLSCFIFPRNMVCRRRFIFVYSYLIRRRDVHITHWHHANGSKIFWMLFLTAVHCEIFSSKHFVRSCPASMLLELERHKCQRTSAFRSSTGSCSRSPDPALPSSLHIRAVPSRPRLDPAGGNARGWIPR